MNKLMNEELEELPKLEAYFDQCSFNSSVINAEERDDILMLSGRLREIINSKDSYTEEELYGHWSSL